MNKSYEKTIPAYGVACAAEEEFCGLKEKLAINSAAKAALTADQTVPAMDLAAKMLELEKEELAINSALRIAEARVMPLWRVARQDAKTKVLRTLQPQIGELLSRGIKAVSHVIGVIAPTAKHVNVLANPHGAGVGSASATRLGHVYEGVPALVELESLFVEARDVAIEIPEAPIEDYVAAIGNMAQFIERFQPRVKAAEGDIEKLEKAASAVESAMTDLSGSKKSAA